MLKPTLRIKNPIKRKHFAIVGMVSVLSIGSAVKVDQFFDQYNLNFRTPILFQTPVVIEKRTVPLASPLVPEVKAAEVTITPTPTPASTWIPGKETTISSAPIAAAKHKWILWNVYAKESSRGKNDGCKAKGKFNGFGFGQSDEKMAAGTGACYETFEEVVSRVDEWFDVQLKSKNLPQALCYYNLGKPNGVLLDDCEYYQDFLRM